MVSKVVKVVRTCAVAGVAALAGCTQAPPPVVAPPPPPVQEAFRARPVAPGFAQDNLAVPPMSAIGVRQTVNAGLTSAQTTWNLRSAYNVAALNCTAPQHLVMAERYGEFLTAHARELSATNRALDSEFRQKYGPGYKDVRDRYMTQVYNYFALPPALNQFCDAAFETSAVLATVPNGGLDVAASTELPKLEAVFLKFFNEYEAYRIAASAWDADYLATYGVPYQRRGANPLSPAATVPFGPGVAVAPASVEGEVPTETPPAGTAQ